MGDTNNDDNDLLDSWFIATKLRPAQSSFRLIARPKLFSELTQLSEKGHVCVTAPAGFGKSSLLSQWRESFHNDAITIAWLTLDEDDGELRQFVSYIVFALQQAGINMGRLELAAEQVLSDIPVKSLLPSLLNAIKKSGQNVILILDDYHRMNSGEVDTFVSEIINLSSEQLRLIISSRIRPTFNVASLIASGRLREIVADSLRFSVAETTEVFSGTLSGAAVEGLHQQTEGWAVSLQLARLAFRGRDTTNLAKNTGVTSDNQDAFPLKSSHIADYFAQQVFDQLPTDMQNFLMRTSILERFDASLANTVSGAENALVYIERAMDLRPLLIPLDNEERWFRYHHLFAEFLQQRLRYTPDVSEIELHIRASNWFEASGQIAEAVRHARLAENYERCANIIQEAGGWELILYGGIGYIRTLLRFIDEDSFSKYPRLRIARAYLCLKDGDVVGARAYMQQISASFEQEDPDFYRDKTIIQTLLNTYSGEIYKTAIHEKLKQIVASWPKGDHLGTAVLKCAQALSNMGFAEFEEASANILSAVKSMRNASSILGINYCYIHLGQIAFLKGDLLKAKAQYDEAFDMAEDNFGSDSGLKSVSHVGREMIQIWQSPELDYSPTYQHAFETVCENDGWLEIYVAGLAAQMAHACYRNNAHEATLAIEWAQQLYENRGIKPLETFSHILELNHASISHTGTVGDDLFSKFSSIVNVDQWQEQNIHWQIGVEAVLATGIWSLRYSGRGFAPNSLNKVISFLKEKEAKLSLVRVMVLKATLLMQTGHSETAYEEIYAAAKLAVTEKMTLPFLVHPNFVSLTRQALKIGRERPGQRLEYNFLSACLKKMPSDHQSRTEVSLSVRENEVLHELMVGKTNKEIARALDMTHHTVKFHLKNLFSKLGAENRVQALHLAKKQGLLDQEI